MLPAWDAAAGLSLSTALLAAMHARDRTGQAQHVSVLLSDVAYAIIGNTGVLAEAELTGQDRPRIGNHVYGALGHDLLTADGRFLMVVAITNRQWVSLSQATHLAGAMAGLEAQLGLDFSTDEGRYFGRAAIVELLTEWSSTRSLDDIITTFDAHRILYGPCRTTTQMLSEDPRASTHNPMFREVEHPGVGRYRVPGSPIRPQNASEGPLSAPTKLGRDTRTVLQTSGLSQSEINDLFENGFAGEAASPNKRRLRIQSGLVARFPLATSLMPSLRGP